MGNLRNIFNFSSKVKTFLREVKTPIFPRILFEQLNNLTLS